MIGIYEADFVVAVVSDVHIAKAVDTDTVRKVEKRSRANSID